MMDFRQSLPLVIILIATFGLSSCSLIDSSHKTPNLVDIKINVMGAEESGEDIPYPWLAHRLFIVELAHKQRDYYGYISIRTIVLVDGVEVKTYEDWVPPSDESQSIYRYKAIYDFAQVDYTQHTTQFKISVDTYNLIPERNESNNTKTVQAFHIPAANG